jgi:hypothetical protein
VIIDDFDVVGVTVAKLEAIRQRAFTFIAYCPLRSPLSLCSPTLFSAISLTMLEKLQAIADEIGRWRPS